MINLIFISHQEVEAQMEDMAETSINLNPEKVSYSNDALSFDIW